LATKSIGVVACGAISRALINAVAAGKLAVRVAEITSRTEQSAELTLEKTHEENIRSPCA
jgi:predicted dinucleotide-utilizing enzyme